MLQVYLVRHGETEWNILRRIQGQSDSALTAHGKLQAKQVAEKAISLGITHIISSDLGRTRSTAEIISARCGCPVAVDPRLREIDMGVLETRYIATLTDEEENWRQKLINGNKNWRIPGGESMLEIASRMHAALNHCLTLPNGSVPLLVSHGMALGCLISTILGLPYYTEYNLRLRNCSLSHIYYQQSPYPAPNWVVKMIGDVSHLKMLSI